MPSISTTMLLRHRIFGLNKCMVGHVVRQQQARCFASFAPRVLVSRSATKGICSQNSIEGSYLPSGRPLQQSVRWMSIVKSPFPTAEIPKVPLSQFVMKNIDLWPQNTAVIDSVTGRSYTYQEVKKYVKSVGSALLKSGLKKGDVVCIHSTNCPEYMFAFLGVTGIGCVATTSNSGFTSRELLYQLKDSNAKYLITSASSLKPAQEAAESYGNLKAMYVIGDNPPRGFRPFSDLLQDDGGLFPDELTYDPNDVVVLPYSSGTTGLPKGVMITHNNFVSNVAQVLSEKTLVDHTTDDCYLAFLPFFHIYGMVMFIGYVFLVGAKVVTFPSFEAELFIRSIEKYKATILHTVPPIGLLLAKHSLVDSIDHSSVREIFCGAAAMGPETEDTIRQRLGVILRQGYGLTETSPVATLCPTTTDPILKRGSIGVLIPGTEAEIRDIETNEPLGPNKSGEVCIRGPQIMKGYLNNPEATKNCIEDGWFRTGDIGYYDDDGYFFFVERLKELIKYKGFQVAPAELEELILTMPGILDVGVVGKSSEDAGELPLAFVVKKSNADTTEDDVIKFVEERVVSSKRLRGGVIMVDAIPKSPSGKILRRVLRERLKEQD